MFSVGEPGAGKTYQRSAVYLLEEFLPNSDPDSVHWSNFPIVFEDREDEGGSRIKGLVSLAGERGISEDEVRRRVRVFPSDVVELCRNRDLKRGEEPYCFWHYFEEEGLSISKCHIAIDEIQYYCGRRSNPKVKKLYEEFLGGGRHTGSTWEFLTQHPDKVAKCISMHTTVRLVIEKAEGRRDPWFRIPYYDWYQIRYLIFRKYNPASWIMEQRKQLIGSRVHWAEVEARFFHFKQQYFGAYNSYSTTEGTGGLTGVAQDPPCKRFGPFRLIAWFLSRNWWRLMFNSTVATILFIGFLFWFARAAQNGSALELVQSVVVPESEKPKKRRSVFEPPPQKPGQVKGELVSVLDDEFSQEVQAVAVPEPVRPFPVPSSTKRDLTKKPQVEQGGIPDDVQDKLDSLQEDVERLSERLAYGSGLVGISNEKIILRDGGTYEVGDVIKFGQYEGLSIEELDYLHRAVRLSDGVWLRLGATRSWTDRLPGTGNVAGDTRGGETDAATSGSSER